MTDLTLFDVVTRPVPTPIERLSADRRRTIRQRQLIDAGLHPLTSPLASPLRLHAGPSRTCGTCRFRVAIGWHSRSYPKCTFGGPTWPRASHGAATDVRAWWPGCVDHEERRDGDE